MLSFQTADLDLVAVSFSTSTLAWYENNGNGGFRRVPVHACTSSTDGGAIDEVGYGCDAYIGNAAWCGRFDNADFDSAAQCCECGRGSSALSNPTAVFTEDLDGDGLWLLFT